jgi:hypothetical protein
VNITLDTTLALAQLIALVVGGFHIWRKIDTRLTAQDSKLSKIEYALFNDGRGMEQQLKEVHKNQQLIITEVAVLKAVRQMEAT